MKLSSSTMALNVEQKTILFIILVPSMMSDDAVVVVLRCVCAPQDIDHGFDGCETGLRQRVRIEQQSSAVDGTQRLAARATTKQGKEHRVLAHSIVHVHRMRGRRLRGQPAHSTLQAAGHLSGVRHADQRLLSRIDLQPIPLRSALAQGNREGLHLKGSRSRHQQAQHTQGIGCGQWRWSRAFVQCSQCSFTFCVMIIAVSDTCD